MTAMTPSRANAHRSLLKLDEILAQQEARGISTHQTGLTRKLIETALLSLADQFDNDVGAEDLLEHFRVSFANLLATFIDTFATNCGLDLDEFAEEFVQDLLEGRDDALDGEPDVSGGGMPSRVMGNA